MAEHPESIDFGDVPEILRLAEEVRRAGEPRVLRRDGEDLAVVVPLPATGNPGSSNRPQQTWKRFDRPPVAGLILIRTN